MPSPVMTLGAFGNLANGVTLAAGGTLTYTIYGNAAASLNLNTATVIETQLEVKAVAGGTVQTTNGVTVSCLAGAGNGAPPDWETVASVSYGSPTIVASGTTARKLYLPTAPGWQVSIKNNDTANAITLYLTIDQLTGYA